MAHVSVGKNKVNLEDLVAIAYHNVAVEVNPACLGLLGRVEENAKFLRWGAVKDIPAGEPIDDKTTRALIAMRLVSLLEAKVVMRPVVAEYLAVLLNQGILPQLVGTDALACLANYCMSGSDDLPVMHASKKTNLKAVLSALSLEVPGLSQKELVSFCSPAGLLGSTMFALQAYQAQTLANVADCVAALSCETAKINPTPFDANAHDVCRPHKDQMVVAGNLRLLLDSSLEVDPKSKKANADVFSSVPEQHAGARGATEACARAAKIEVNSSEPAAGSFHHEHVLGLMRALQSSLCVLASASEQRAREILNQAASYGLAAGLAELGAGAGLETVVKDCKAVTDAEVPTDSLPVALNLARAVKACHLALTLEASINLQALGVKEASMLEAFAKKEADKKKKQAEHAAKMAALGKKVKVKEDKKAGKVKGGLALGSGTAAFRTFLAEAASFAAAASAADFQGVQERVGHTLDALQNRTLANNLTLMLTATNQVCKPKIPKGTRDSTPEQMSIRDKAFGIIHKVFRSHGAVGIDTPVFERREVLTGKYGEDSKLIYDLADQGGEQLCLRYDLTVPFARYIASHKISNIKRYHIARVYRRDNPAMNKGRYREFYQCDYDIAGNYAAMVPDSECLKVLCDILTGLNLGGFKVKLNHRKLLDGLMAVCGVPADKFRTICSAVDKLDKSPWSVVKDEMVNQKGLEERAADLLGTYVTRPPAATPWETLQELRADELFMSNTSTVAALNDLELAFKYLQALGCLDKISFDLSLARGLDYYTGVIYEAVLTDTDQVGSIAAGGRYDGLVGMFSGTPVPAVGVSIGIERIFAILEDLERSRGKIRATTTQILVASVGKDLLCKRMELCNELWKAGLKVEFLYDLNPKPKKQMDYALENSIPFILWIGEAELEQGVVKLKNMEEHSEEVVQRDQVVQTLLKRVDPTAYYAEVLKLKDEAQA